MLGIDLSLNGTPSVTASAKMMQARKNAASAAKGRGQ